MCDAPIGQGFGDMRPGHRIRACQVGDGARHFQHPVIAARRQPHPLSRFGQQFGARRVRGGDRVQQFAFGLGIGADRLLREALTLDSARRRHPRRHLFTAFGGGRQSEIAGADACHFDMHVDAVEQRS